MTQIPIFIIFPLVYYKIGLKNNFIDLILGIYISCMYDIVVYILVAYQILSNISYFIIFIDVYKIKPDGMIYLIMNYYPL